MTVFGRVRSSMSHGTLRSSKELIEQPPKHIVIITLLVQHRWISQRKHVRIGSDMRPLFPDKTMIIIMKLYIKIWGAKWIFLVQPDGLPAVGCVEIGIFSFLKKFFLKVFLLKKFRINDWMDEYFLKNDSLICLELDASSIFLLNEQEWMCYSKDLLSSVE